MTTTTLAVLVPLLPFLGAAAGLALGRTAPGFVRPLAVLPTLAALALAVVVAVHQGGDEAVDAATELTPTGAVPIELALHLDGFAALVAVLVAFVATCVQIYSTGYLRDDARYPYVRRARLPVHLRDAARRLLRRPDGAAGRLGNHGHLLVLPGRPLLGDTRGPAPPPSRRSS
ncbi:hypothetical protein SGLAM104S_08165 [Streptomyces glaucescens]